MPASRRARAMIFAPRSWPSRPGFAMTTRIFRATRGSLCRRFGPAARPLLRDEVPVPVEAPLRHPLERRVIDVDDAEALPVPPAPLEVVEQRPDEVALHGGARLDGPTDCGDVPLEEAAARRIAHAPAVAAHAGDRAAVL